MTHDASDGPRLSVIIAGWNAAGSIGDAIASVLAQADVPLECLVVDDGSTDGTEAIVEAVAAGDPRVRFIRVEHNEGVSKARNRALDVARGEWLGFLDADDRLLPGGLAAMLRAAEEHDALAVVGQRISTDGERTWFPPLYDIPDIRVPGVKSLARNPGLLYYAGPAGKLFKRSCAAELRFEGRVLGDQPWVVRAMLRAGDRIVVVDDVVYEWRRPPRDRWRPTLTTSREGSARLGAEAVAMAGVAWHVVAAEIERTIEPAARRPLEVAYFGRLIRADLEAQLWKAVQRGDPDIGSMFQALAGLLEAVPAEVVRASDAVAPGLLEPPLRGWHRLSRRARAAYWALVRTALELDPGLPAKATAGSARTVLRLGAGVPPVIGQPAAGLVVRVARVTRALRRRVPGRGTSQASHPAGRPTGHPVPDPSTGQLPD